MSDNIKTSDISNSMEKMINFSMDQSEKYYEIVEKEEAEKTRTAKNILSDILNSNGAFTVKNNVESILIGMQFIGLACYLLYLLYSIIISIYYLDSSHLGNYYLNISIFVISGLCFVYSTKLKFWNFHKQKIVYFSLNFICFFIYLINLATHITIFIIVPCIRLLKPVNLSYKLIEFLGQFLVLEIVVAAAYLILKFFISLLYNPLTINEILGFHMNMHIDQRKNKKWLYDIAIVQHMIDGSYHVIKEADRFLHLLINGTTGTGKTSTTINTQVESDLTTKIKNIDMQKKEVIKLLKAGKIEMIKQFEDSNFHKDNFKAKDGFEKDYQDIFMKYRDCGITVVAPNESLTDTIYDLAIAKGLKCNRVDPIHIPGTNKLKEGSIGFNPLYISQNIKPWDINREIIKKATLFADVLQALNEMKGKGDQYFTGINRSITTSLTILLCKTYPRLNNGKQPNPGHVQYLVNDFSRCKIYIDELKKVEDRHEFEFVIDFITTDLLGSGRDKMKEHSTGLRVLINEFLTNPLIRSVLCSEETIDMDLMLSEGQITVFNYALQLGTTDSIGFGLFFTLSFNDAVLRRPGTEKTRLPHFYDIDEFPVLLHPSHERCFSLFRQYRVGMIVAIQSLDQMDKSDLTKYLKGVIMGCSHHIVFGRGSTSEMQIYSELAGKDIQFTTVESDSQTSLTTDAPTYSYSKRTTAEEVDIMSGTQVRNRLFQEVTVFSVVDGNNLKPFFGKVSFLPKNKFNKVKRIHINWDKYYVNKPDEIDKTLYKNSIKLNSNGLDLSFPMTTKATVIIKENIQNPEEEKNVENGNIETYIDNSEDIYINAEGDDNEDSFTL